MADSSASLPKHKLVEEYVGKTEEAIVKIQSIFRKILTLRKLEDLAMQKKQKLVRSQNDKNPEGSALNELVVQLKAKNITPEAFYRICDITHSRSIPNDTFAECIKNFGLYLTENQTKRLILLLDESFDNQITYSEYCNALEAFGLDQEKHFLGKSGGVKRKYQDEVMEKVINILNQKNMDAQDLFNACDSDSSGEVSVDELVKVLQQIKPSLMLKDIECVHRYFDVDKSGLVTLEEFEQRFNRATKMVEQRRERAFARGADPDDEFGEEEVDEGDEGMIGDAVDTVKGWFGVKKKVDPNAQKLAPVVTKMESDGVPAKVFVDAMNKIIQSTRSKKSMKAFEFDLQLRSFYPQINATERKQVIDLCALAGDKREVAYAQMESLIASNSKATGVKAEALLKILANSIYLQNKKASGKESEVSPDEVINTYLTQQAKLDPKFKPAQVTQASFAKLISQVVPFQTKYSNLVFQSFKSPTALKPIITKIQASISPEFFAGASESQKSTTVKTSGKKSLNQVIQGFDGLSPRSQSDASVGLLIKEMKKYEIEASGIYKMASGGTELCSLNKLTSSFHKIGTRINPLLIDQALASFGKPMSKVSKTMFLNVFSEKFDKAVNPPAASSGKKTRPATASAHVKVTASDNFTLIKKLQRALENNGQTPEEAFALADTSGDGQLHMRELRNALKEILTDEDVTPADFKQCMITFDTNKNGLISLEEFTAQFEAQDKPAAKPSVRPQTSKGRPKKVKVQPENLVFKVLLHQLEENSNVQMGFSEGNMLFIDFVHGSKTKFMGTDTIFSDYYFEEKKLLGEFECNQVYEFIAANPRDVIGEAFSKLQNGIITRADPFHYRAHSERVQAKCDHQGLIDKIDAAEIQSQVILSSGMFIEEFNQMLEGMGLEPMSLKRLKQILPKVLVSTDPDQGEVGMLNWLCFASSLFMADSPFELDDNEYDEMMAIYVSKIHKLVDLKKQSDAFSRNLKGTMSMRDYISKLNQMIVDGPDQSCISEKSTQIVLPAKIDEKVDVVDFLSYVGAIQSKYCSKTQAQLNPPKSASRGLKKVGSLPPTGTLIQQIEDKIQDSIQFALRDYLLQNSIQENTLLKVFQKKNPQISKALVKEFVKEANDGEAPKSGLGIGSLVRYICSNSDSFNYKQTIETLAESYEAPIEETLAEDMVNYEDGVTKDEFLEAFRDKLDTWQLLCLFYQMDVGEEEQDEIVEFDTLVAEINKAKGIKPGKKKPTPAKQPASAAPKPAAAAQKTTVIAASAKETASKSGKPSLDLSKSQNVRAGNALIDKEISPQEMKQIQQKIDELVVDPKTKKNPAGDSFKQAMTKYDFDPCVKGVVMDSEETLQVLLSFSVFQKYLQDREQIKQTLKNVSTWIEGFEGNDEAGCTSYILDSFMQTIKKEKELTEGNALILRVAFADSENTNKDSKADVDFTEIDLMMITMLVLDTDMFNRLRVQPEFVHEFIRMPAYNAKTKSDIELFEHFIDDCERRISLRMRLAILCIREKYRFETQNLVLNILDDAQWQKVRFSAIAIKIIGCLKDPKKKKIFNKEFTDNDNELTYFQFYNLLMNKLSIQSQGTSKVIHEDMYEDFECYLDDEATAYIDRFDVFNFLQHHNYEDADYQVEESKSQRKVQFMNKQARSLKKTFINDEKDYFRGVKTIFNNERAAITACESIVKKLKSEGGKHWIDPDFGPKDENDVDGKQKSLFFDEETPTGSIPAEAIKYTKIPGGVFIQDDASANEVKQGQLGDCWFIGALSVLANRDELIKGGTGNLDLKNIDTSKLVIDQHTASSMSKGVYPPIFHPFRKYGLYVMRFNKNYHWRYVLIDERIPMFASNDEPLFGRCTNKEELWVNLIEKAYAKLHGCYWSLKSGYIDDGLAEMTGMVCEKLTIHDQNGFIEANKDLLWEQLLEAKHNQSLMGCSVQGGTESRVRVDGQFVGILSGHAYSLNDVFEIDDPNMENPRKTHRILRLRNPWGQQEWNGKWSDESEEIELHKETLQAMINELEEEEQFKLGDTNDGTFLINYQSFREIFTRIFIANDFPDEWWCVRFNSSWNKSHPGLPKKTADTFGQNPQYLIVPTENCELFISLGQDDGRIIDEEGKYDNYPFPNRIVSTMIAVIKLKPGEDRAGGYFQAKAENRIVAMTKPPKVSAEQSLRMKLNANERYAIVVCPKKGGIDQKFYLSLYFDIQLHDVDIRNIQNPKEKYEFIMEEYEKSDRNVPEWKVDWVTNNVQDFIGSTDSGLETSFKSQMSSSKQQQKKRMTVSKKKAQRQN